MTETASTKRPYFFWDYDVTDKDVREILQGDDVEKKSRVITRILEYGRWDDIWRYLTVDDVRDNFSRLRFRWPHVRELWAYALEVWADDD